MGKGDTITVRRADRSEWRRVETFYRERKYRGVLSSEAIVMVAERGSDLLGVGRVHAEDGVLVLRGMRVDPPFQRRGVGARMQTRLVAEVGARSCYCIPYTHLRQFYRRAGFIEVGLDAAPFFLRDRVLDYRATGLDVILMRKPGIGTNGFSDGPARRRRGA
jgi:GNAT superfamily N-acetyltransferase